MGGTIRSDGSEIDLWGRALAGDREAFWQAVEPHLPELLYRARRDLAYHRSMGDLLPGEPTAPEVVADALARAWRLRRRKPSDQSLRVWLLGRLYRVIRDTVLRERRLQRLWSVTLENPVPVENPTLVDDEFYDWYQPDDLPRWEDALPSDEPTPDLLVEEKEVFAGGRADVRQAAVLRDEHGLSPREVGQVLGVGTEEAHRLLAQAPSPGADATG
ncbi:RNA polymerase sigma factor [Deferrisoma palaeochoriense]